MAATQITTTGTTSTTGTTQSFARIAETEELAQLGMLGMYAVFRGYAQMMPVGALQTMERRERIVLLLLNGKRTIQEIAYLVHRSELEVARSLMKLTKQGLAEYIGQRSAEKRDENFSL